jgi:bacillithiol system protein YtxJ
MRGAKSIEDPPILTRKRGQDTFSGKGSHVSTIIALGEEKLPDNCLVYKHSTTCSISATAGQEVRAMKTELPIYWINVREQRALSNWVAETYKVDHESPQLILIKDGKPLKVWSHFEVNRTALG